MWFVALQAMFERFAFFNVFLVGLDILMFLLIVV